VLVGTTSVEISELLSRALKLRNIPHNVLNAKLHQREAEIVAEAGRAGAVTIATNMAGRGTDIKLAPEAKAAGGLAIVGTERHDSRRVDRQLRGRAGRQGDPGSSQFFVSLEDNLMRLFGSDRIAGLMDRMGHVEGEMIQHGLVSKSIERAQKKVEENNFGIRKRLLDYDNVMNAQREGIYKRRRNALYGERLQVDIANMLYDLCDTVVRSTHPDRNFEGFALEVFEQLGISELPFDAATFAKSSASDLTQKLFDHTSLYIKEKNDSMAKRMAPVLEGIHRDHNGQIQNILVPFADGEKGLQVSVPLQKAVDTRGQSALRELEKVIVLSTIDDAWKEHLRNMDDLRTNVQGAVYEQKDPLLIYKHESFKLFQDMMDQVNRSAVSFLFRAFIPEEAPQAAPAQRPAAPRPQTTASRSLVSESTSTTASGAAAKNTPPASRPAQAPVVKQKSAHRPNDTVTVVNLVTGEQRTLKFKAAEPLLNQGWMLLDSSGS
jgi:preprotein translocase subunit SecA